MVRAYKGIFPVIDPTVFIDDSAQVIGEVTIGRHSSVWCNAVLRGDVNTIRIGERSNVQDGVVIHGTYQKYAVVIENDVSIGHNAVLHGCVIRSTCLIGMGAILLDNAEIGENCIIGAGAVVTEGMIVPPFSLVLGVPGKRVRALSQEEVAGLTERAARYVMYQQAYQDA